MAVSKRLRFEILRRDNHTCRYCGASAPDATLTVDHVVAVALGGSDHPSNLVAACKDCNSGKSATPADASLVADVSTDALRWARAMDFVVADRLAEIEAEDAYVEEFRQCWNGFTYVRSGEPVDLPHDWHRTLAHWYALKMPIEIVRNAVTKAMGKNGLRGDDAEFRYMAGIVWATLTEMQEQARADLTPAVTETADDSHCGVQWCDIHAHRTICGHCHERDCLWACGYEEGNATGQHETYTEHLAAIDHYEFLSMACDSRITVPFLVALDAD